MGGWPAQVASLGGVRRDLVNALLASEVRTGSILMFPEIALLAAGSTDKGVPHIPTEPSSRQRLLAAVVFDVLNDPGRQQGRSYAPTPRQETKGA